jgi:outer membrane protein assembly factor BamB
MRDVEVPMKKYSKTVVLFFALVGLVLTGCKGGGKDQAASDFMNDAKLVFSIGDVQVKTGEIWNAAQQQMKLVQGNEIKTGAKAQCNIAIGTDSFITVKESSHLVIEEIIKNASGTENNSLELKVGRTIVNPKKLLKGDSFRIKTPTAVAAVRGTKFVVESQPGEQMKVAVVDGKVELSRRVPALDRVDDEVIAKSEALTMLKEKVDEETIVIDANSSAFIDNKKAEAENIVINDIVAEHVETIKEELAKEKIAEKKEEMKEVQVADNQKAPEDKKEEKSKKFLKQEKDITTALASLDIMKKEKEEVVQIKIQEKIETRYVEEVKELDKAIDQAREQKLVEQKKEGAVTQLTINSPVKKSSIYVNSKFIGYDTAVLKPMPGASLTVEVMAPGFGSYKDEVTLKEGENRVLDVQLMEKAKLTIISPVSNSSIYVNSKFVGKDRVTVQPGAGKKIEIQVVSRGFKKYTAEVVLNTGESKEIKVELEQEKLLDRLNWSQNVGSQVLVDPIAYGNYLLVVAGDGSVVAMNREGARIWKANLKRGIESTPVIHEGNAYVVANNGDFYSIRITTGQISWKNKMFGALLFGSKPVIEKDTIFLATSFGRVYAFSTAGKELWHTDLENGVYSSVAYNNGKLYVGAEDHYIYAMDAKKGNVQWKFKTDSRMVSSSPMISGKTLFVGCYSGSFYAIDTDKGNEKWKFKSGDSIFSTPLISGGMVFFGSNDGNLYALSADGGKMMWKLETGSKVKSSPSTNGEFLFITSGNQIYALNMKNGGIQWTHRFDRSVKTSAGIKGNDIFVGLDSGEVASVRNSLKAVYR